jgi:hypothetical protein
VGTPKGTIILVSGHGGTTFFNSNFANTYLGDGYRVVQLAWATDWEDSGGISLKSAACRGATAFKYVFDNVQAGDRTTASAGRAPAVEAPPSRTRLHTTASQTISTTW